MAETDVDVVQLLNALHQAIDETDVGDDAPAVALLNECAYRVRELEVYRERFHRVVDNVDTHGQAIGWLQRDLKAIRNSDAITMAEGYDLLNVATVDRSDISPAVRASVLSARIVHAEQQMQRAAEELFSTLSNVDVSTSYVQEVADVRRAQLQALGDWQREWDEAQRQLDALQPPTPNAVAGVPDAMATVVHDAPLLP